MSGFDQTHNNAFFNFNNLTPQQLNMLRQQNQMQQAVQMSQHQQPQPQPPPGSQPQQMQQHNPMMPQLGLPAGFNQQQLQALMAQQQSQLANGLMPNNQNPLMQMMRPQSMVQQQAQQMQQQQPQQQLQMQQQHSSSSSNNNNSSSSSMLSCRVRCLISRPALPSRPIFSSSNNSSSNKTPTWARLPRSAALQAQHRPLRSCHTPSSRPRRATSHKSR